MKQTIQIIASVYGSLAIVFGAFGAHALKKVLSDEKLSSFEVGVRYQIYHALLLLVMSILFTFDSSIEKWSARLIVTGTFLFSFSIYFLSLQDVLKTNLKFLGPITPLGGLLLILGWVFMLFTFVKQ